MPCNALLSLLGPAAERTLRPARRRRRVAGRRIDSQIQTKRREGSEKGGRPGECSRCAPRLSEKIQEALRAAHQRSALDAARSRRRARPSAHVTFFRQQSEKVRVEGR